MPLKTAFFSAFLAALLLAQPAAAAEWDVDKAHSGIYFDIIHIYSTTRGVFTDYDGTVKFDPANPADGAIEFSVKVTSVDTGVQKRDNHLRTKDFFEVSEYPEMRFVSASIAPAGPGKFMVTGDLTVKDVTKTIEVHMTFGGPSDHPLMRGKQVVGMDFAFTIDRLEYNVGGGKYYEMGVLDKYAKLFVTLELTN